MPDLEGALLAKAAVAARVLRPGVDFLRSLPAYIAFLGDNIAGLGVGWRLKEGRAIKGEWCLRVYVRRKLPRHYLGPWYVPKFLKDLIDDFPIDIVETGRFQPLAGAAPAPIPLRIGADVQLAGSWRHGTLGAFVECREKLHLLSCGHVLDGRGRLGQPVFSNGAVVAHLSEQDLLQPEAAGSEEHEDCALAVLSPQVHPRFDLPAQLGRLTATSPAAAVDGMEVWKAGQDVQQGVILDRHADIRVHYSSMVAVLKNQLLVKGYPERFSLPGDSGALVVTGGSAGRAAVGMVVGANRPGARLPDACPGEWTLAAPMSRILAAFGAELVTG